ncbi:biotin synthetase [Pseudescherichia vulneris]|nr:biotin synthetase [Pseudescherichia vulneris]
MAHHARWTLSQVTELFEKPLLDLLFEAQTIHRQHFDPRQVQVSTLLSIKTGPAGRLQILPAKARANKNRARDRSA